MQNPHNMIILQDSKVSQTVESAVATNSAISYLATELLSL
jgi:hypothetical protein